MLADQQLRASLKEIDDLKAALDEHAIVAITDAQGKITYVNDKFCAISKYSRKELLGQDHRVINSSHHSKSFISELWTTIARGKVWKGEIKNRAKDGSFYWVDTTIVPFLNEDGKPRQYIAIRADVTNRKEAEEGLRKSEEQLRTMISSIKDYAIVILDTQGNVLNWNLGAETIKGWRAEEIIGRNFSRFFTPKDVAVGKPERELVSAAKSGHSEDQGWRVRKDGSHFWANVVVTALHNSDGQLRGYVKVTCDLTEHKLAEDQLKKSFKEVGDLKAALDEHAIVAITDARGKITYVNDKFCAISKYDREELLGQDHRIINSSHHPKSFIHELWTTIAHGRVWKGEIKNRAKDGSFYWVDTTIVPFLNDDGEPRQYIAIRADITKRKEAEEQLRSSLKEVGDLKAALDEHAIVAITDAQGKITYVNDKFCAISKYSREELLGQDHRVINSSHHPKPFIRELWTTIAQGKVWKGEIKNRAKDGSFYWVDTTIVPFLNDDGKPRQYIAIRADITKRKEAEEKIQRMNVELEGRVTERTAELKHSNQELEQFAYVASHDMREPLRAVSGFAQILKRNCQAKLDARDDEMIGHIVDGAKRMADIIDDLLALSRIGSHRRQFELMEITKPLELALKNLSVIVHERGARIQHEALPSVQVDGSQLVLLFQNLIGNAIKFCKDRPPEIQVGASRRADGFFLISVRDNGIGIEAKYFDRIFGIFQRLHTRDEYPGTGIGLAICKKIIERHGGEIWLESTLGVGTTFYFTLPEGGKNG